LIRQAGYILAVLWWSLPLFVLGLLVTTPWSGEAQSLCEEEREIIGLSLEPLSDQGLSVATLEPLGFAARSGIQVGDVIEQANNQLLRNCRGYRKAVQEAKKDKKALLLLIHTKNGKRAVVFERVVWEEPEK
jgi:C-terminal processing protease CtpA/Prc